MSILFSTICGSSLSASSIHVSPEGEYKTVEAGIAAARKNKIKEIRLAPGTYYLEKTVVLTPEDNGLRIAGASSENTVISGGVLLENLKFTPFQNGIMQADLAVEYPMDQLFVNGRRLDMARFPNKETGRNKNVFDCWSLSENRSYAKEKDALLPECVKRWNHPETGYIHAMHTALWGDMHWKIEKVDAKGKIKAVGGYQNNRPTGWHRVFRFVENIFEELDTPGEWFYDRTAKKLYVYPLPGMNLNTAKIESIRLPNLFEFRGESIQKPIENIMISNLKFTHAARTFMENKERLLRSDWTLYRGAALSYSFSKNCSIQDCEFINLGGNAVIFDGYNDHALVAGSIFREIGANGIIFAGRLSSVRNPLFGYGDVPDYKKMSKEKGPASEDYPRGCIVEDCIITRTGRDEKQTAPIQISTAYHITVRSCSIYDVPRAGINISEGTFGGHLIEQCDIFNTVLETGDHGSFNSWGRDRYWQSSLDGMDEVMTKNPEFPFLDILGTTVIRSNRWRCDHGWDVDLDDGSSDYLIENNLLLHGGLKLREGYKRIARNNQIVNNTLHPHCWLKNSGDTVTGNVFHEAPRLAGRFSEWGKEVNRNIYTESSAAANRFRKKGWDIDSISFNPEYKDPKNGDYTILNLPANSPFQNLPMNIYGVKSERLKKIAKTPKFPIPHKYKEKVSASSVKGEVQWGSMKLAKFNGANEFSAYGVTPDTPGYVILSNPVSPLKNNDLITKIDGKPLISAKQFEFRDGMKLTVIRDQTEQTLSIHPKK